MNHDFSLKYFGNQQSCVSLQEIKESRFSLTLQELVQDQGFENLMVLDQVHSASGIIIDRAKSQKSSWFEHEGDFIITQEKNIALCILTADCIPLILHDINNQVVAIVHAGWKGSFLGVAQNTIRAMIDGYGTKVSDIFCYFGPSARICCYEVSDDFVHMFWQKYPEIASKVDIFIVRGTRWFFDNAMFLQHILKNFGILAEHINTQFSICTICNYEFCSFRRDQQNSNRQVSMVGLKL